MKQLNLSFRFLQSVFQNRGMLESPATVASATQRLVPRRQTIEDAYSPPANFLEIDVCNPLTHEDGKDRFTDYEVSLRVRKFL